MTCTRPRKKYFQVLSESYTSEFPCFISLKKGEKFAFCSMYTSCGGKADLKLHITLLKHQGYMQSVSTGGDLGSFLQNDGDNSVIHAECLFTAFLVEHNIPLSRSDRAGPLFRKMFPKAMKQSAIYLEGQRQVL